MYINKYHSILKINLLKIILILYLDQITAKTSLFKHSSLFPTFSPYLPYNIKNLEGYGDDSEKTVREILYQEH